MFINITLIFPMSRYVFSGAEVVIEESDDEEDEEESLPDEEDQQIVLPGPLDEADKVAEEGSNNQDSEEGEAKNEGSNKAEGGT